ncbi:MAG: methyl-accepting chemotaxis protein [Actinomycetota bacterium]
MIRNFRRLPIRLMLGALTGLALVGLPLVSLIVAFDRFQAVGQADAIVDLVDVGVRSGDLVHELQKERGASALYLASGGERFGDELRAQHELTDSVLERFVGIDLAVVGELDPDVSARAEAARTTLGDLATMRTDVLGLSIELPDAVGWYTGINGGLIGASAAAVPALDDPEVRSDVAAYVAFLNGKERSGLERAQLSAAFARDAYGPGQFATVASLIAKQEAYLDTFQSLAAADVLAFFDDREAQPAVAEVARLRAIALAADSGFGVDSTEWFAVMTERIDLLKEVEDLQTSRLLGIAADIRSDAWQQLVVAVALSIVLIGVITLLGILIPRTIAGRLHRLNEATRAVAEDRHDGNPVPSEVEDELGLLTDSFNTMTEMLSANAATMEATARQVAERAELTSSDSDALSKSMAETSSSLEQINLAVDELSATAAVASNVSAAALDAADRSSTAMDDLHRTSDEIGDILELITSITKQTTLLALNANVEATRAGLDGTGFGAVADQVGEVAKETEQAASKISARIEAIRSATNSVSDANDQINDTIRDVQEISTRIAAAIHEHGVTMAEIGRTMGEATDRAHHIAGAVDELALSVATKS